LVFLAILIGLPTTRYAASHALPAASTLQNAEKPVTGLPDPLLVNRSPSHRETQPLDSSARPNLRFACLTAADGLSFSLVTSILQDQRGFMWFGTRYGLDKYDGKNFTVYIPTSGDEFLLGNYVFNIYQDRAGDMWLNTYADVVRWDIETKEFVHYKSDPANPNSLTPGRPYITGEDSTGTVWVTTTGGLNRYDPLTDTFTRFYQDIAVYGIYHDRREGIWLGTSNGLWYYSSGSIEGQDPEIFQNDAASSDSLSDNAVGPIYEDQQGFLWVGTYGGGLNRLDRVSGKFTHFSHTPNDPYSLSDNSVYSILEDKSGRLWIGTQDGLNLFDRSTGRFFHYHAYPDDPHSLKDDVIDDIYQDRTGVIWIATLAGICKLNETASSFTFYQEGSNPLTGKVPGQPELKENTQPSRPPALSNGLITSVYEDRNSILWVGTSQGGLNRVDRSTGQVTVYQHDPADPASISQGEVTAIYQDRERTLWIGTQDGLNRFNPQTGAFETEAALQGLPVGPIVEDRQNNLWLGTWIGLMRRAPGASTFNIVSLGDDPAARPRILSLFVDHTGALWVNTQNDGLYRLEPSLKGESTPTVIHFPQDSNDPKSPGSTPVSNIYEDRNGNLWLGSLDNGLLRFNRDTQTFVHYLPDTGKAKYVSCIREDAQGFLWMGTVLGLARFDPRSETFSYFDARDGLEIGEGTDCFQNKQGEMFFGSISGLVTFFPDQIRDNPDPPAVVITALNLNNQPFRTDLMPDEQIKLSYQENYLSFDFVALDYTAPDKNQYAFKMEGLDADWIQAGTRRHADYPDLQPGTYTFRVKASNNSGVWNEQGAAVQIIITPPFWQTWWFLGLVGVALAGAVAGGVRLRLKSVERRSRELEIQVANRTRELVALNEIAAILNLPLDLQGVLRAALGKTLEVTRIEAGGIYLLVEKTQILTIAAHQGFSPQFIRQIDGLQVGEGFSGLVIQSGESLVVNDVSADPRLTRIVVREEGFNSLAVVPLRSRDQVRGTLFALTRGHREFTKQDIQLLESIGHQVGAAIENAGLYEDTKNQVAQLTALQNTAKAVASTLELKSLLNLIIQQATTLLQADGGFINLVDWDRRVDEVVAVAGIAPPVVGERISLENSLSGWVTLHNQATISNDVQKDDRVARSILSWVIEEHIQSAAAAPMIVRDQVMGTLLVISRKEGKERFVQADLDLLVAFANQAAIAIENANLYVQSKELAVTEERRRQELEALFSADERMQRYLHQDQVLQALVDVAVDILQADKSSVFWWDEKKEKLVTRVSRGFDPQVIQQLQFPRGEGIVGRVTLHGETVLVEDTFTDPNRSFENPRNVKFAMDEGVRSFMFFPIMIGDEILGAFNVSFLKPHAAGEEEKRLFQALTQRAALQIENARLYEQSQELAVLEERSRLARELHDAVTQTLFSASLVAEALPATWEKNPQEGRGLLQELRGLSRGALAEMRSLLLELRPAALLETSLADLLRQLGEAASGRTGIPVSVQVEGQGKLPPDVHIAFYRITQEALNNVVKHARARQATVRLCFTNGGADSAPIRLKVLLAIRDDGRGFDLAQIPHNRLGLGIMQERAQAVGASLIIESQPGHGTEVTVLWEKAGKEEAK